MCSFTFSTLLLTIALLAWFWKFMGKLFLQEFSRAFPGEAS
jgi:hypothetical protein